MQRDTDTVNALGTAKKDIFPKKKRKLSQVSASEKTVA